MTCGAVEPVSVSVALLFYRKDRLDDLWRLLMRRLLPLLNVFVLTTVSVLTLPMAGLLADDPSLPQGAVEEDGRAV